MGNLPTSIEGETLKEAIEHSNVTCVLLNSNLWITRPGNLYRNALATVPLFYKHDMTHIYAGNGYTIYCNYDTQQFYAEGDNAYGACAIPKRTRYKDKNGQYLLRSINYFRVHNIIIRKCCTNITGKCSYWITDDNQIYANGINDHHQLGIASARPQYLPFHIESLSDLHSVVDIKSNATSAVALCRMDITHIVHGYCRKVIVNDPASIESIKHKICSFYGHSAAMYHTQEMTVGELCNASFGTLQRINNHEYGTWKEISDLNGKDIIKIDCCNDFFLFLESNGIIWKYQNVELQNGTDDHQSAPLMRYCIQSFNFTLSNTKNGASGKIIDMACGVNNGLETNYVLLIDEKHGIYSWSEQYAEPQLVYGLEEHKIRKIACGTDHAYAMNDKHEHFLWGNNYQNECMNGKNTKCKTPYCINKTVERIGIRTGKSYIKQVSVGTNCTKLIVGYPQ